MNRPQIPNKSSRFWIVAAFASVYLIWGSTYLAIRFAIDTLPPFLMAGTRFLIAGAVLYAWTRLRGGPRPTRFHWRGAVLVGGLLLLGGNGGVVWAEQTVPSGLTALLVATMPFWIVLLNWARRDGVRPGGQTVLGLALGLGGIALLVGPGNLAGGDGVDLLGAGAVMLGALCWATGSILSRSAGLPSSPLLATGMEMLAGGALLVLAGLVTGEWRSLDLGKVSLDSVLAWGYLVVFGSLVAFTAYVWLLRVTTPARASTYAYVNPVVAVFLGWALGGEPLTAQTLVAAAVIIGAVAIITSARTHRDVRADVNVRTHVGKYDEAA